MPQIAMMLPRFCGGYMSSITDCDSGPSAAPNAPCARRNRIIWSSVCARPHIIEVTVKPVRLTMRKFFLPKRAAIQPTGAVMIAAATM
jgi:hypothetical protein